LVNGCWHNFQVFYIQIIFRYTFIPEVKTVNKESYVDYLRRLKDAAGRKLSEKWKTNSWSLFHRNFAA
jgi:hypothetical protein